MSAPQDPLRAALEQIERLTRPYPLAETGWPQRYPPIAATEEAHNIAAVALSTLRATEPPKDALDVERLPDFMARNRDAVHGRDEWVAASPASTPPEGLRETLERLIEAGDDIKCYPEGAVGFEDWYEEREKARAALAASHAPDPRAGLAEDVDYEKMRKDRGWPTPNHMRRTADALDSLTPARYGDVLRWFADLADAALAPSAEPPETA